jgi:putative endonuclease
MWLVYILRSVHGRLYTGVTTDVARRLRQHNGYIAGGAKATRADRPWRIAYAEAVGTKSEALKREALIKKLSKKGKLALIADCRQAEDVVPELLN